MRTIDRTPLRECRLLLWPVALLLTLALATQGCSYVKSLWDSGDDTDLDDAAYANEGEPLPPPIANVAISYRRPGDALARATVIKYFGAEVIANHQRDASHTESVVRFDGGVPIWEFKADEGTFGSITGVGAAKYTLKNIEYAKLLPRKDRPSRSIAALTTSFRSSVSRARPATRRSRCKPMGRFRPTTLNRGRAAVTCCVATSRRISPSR